ncbi:hypothetical protein QUF50_03810 [Thiotrichales bacterium HSG1]|nr:hypothetical protein [Thiotrichales bacterium HSG1]
MKHVIVFLGVVGICFAVFAWVENDRIEQIAAKKKAQQDMTMQVGELSEVK